MVFNALQPRKHDSPIDVIALGISIAFSLEQPSKARFSNFMLGANITSSRLQACHFSKQCELVELRDCFLVSECVSPDGIPSELPSVRTRL